MKNCQPHTNVRIVRDILKKEKTRNDKTLRRVFFQFPALYTTAKNMKVLNLI